MKCQTLAHIIFTNGYNSVFGNIDLSTKKKTKSPSFFGTYFESLKYCFYKAMTVRQRENVSTNSKDESNNSKPKDNKPFRGRFNPQ